MPKRRSLTRQAGFVLWHGAQNLRYARGAPRILVVRDSRHHLIYDVLLNWLELQFPDLRARFELHTLPCRPLRWSRYALHVPWLPDPVEAWSPRAYGEAERVARACDRHGVPIVNRVDRLTNAGKSRCAALVGAAGFRTPRMARIEDVEDFRETRLGVPLPLFVREDWGHGGRMVRADTDAEVRALPVDEFARPVAVELVDVQSDDGLFRKYRYVLAGDRGIRQSIHVSKDWCVRGSPDRALYTDALREEEIDFTEGTEPLHDRFVAARENLGLDFLAFDYSLDLSGNLVVWEANPLPYLHFSVGRRHYRSLPTTRVLAALTALYFDRAAVGAPEDLTELITT
jgi:hypothetical protein